MPSNKNTTPTAIDPDHDEPLELSDLVARFADHAGTFQSFKVLQSLFNEHVASGALTAYTEEGLEHFIYHFTLISETVFDLETHAADNVIKAMAKKKAS